MSTVTATSLGQQLVDYCRQQKWEEAVEALYADSIVALEPFDGPDGSRRTEGIEAVKAKGETWMAEHEVHSCEVEGPYPHADERFAVVYRIDVTHKPSGTRMKMDEVGLYTVEGGKITREEYFYPMPE